MCGIVGYVGETNALYVLIPALQRLEYRGYDSAGIAVIKDGKIRVAKKKGKISQLISYLSEIDFPTYANIGIGHTRWATHGEPSDNNAHPHLDCTGKITVVHNGIIENFAEIKSELISRHSFSSETDTEIVAHLIEEEIKTGKVDFETAFERAISKIDGTWAIASFFSDEPDKIICARKGAPLVIGVWDKGFIISSDIPSLLPFTRKIIPLDDGDIAVVSSKSVKIKNKGIPVEKKYIEINWDISQAEKGGFRHFMLKEIFEQPHVVEDTIKEFISMWNEVKSRFVRNKRFVIAACGTSYHAGLLGKLWLEHIARVRVEVDYASEIRYKDFDFSDTVLIAISQSGETADTLEAARKAKAEGAEVIALVNILGSTLARESDIVLHTNAGPEIGVAATKTFLSQITSLYLLAVMLSGEDKNSEFVKNIRAIPDKIVQVLNQNELIQSIAEYISNFKHALYLGRWLSYPVAMEGALKLKEISYIHAEAYPAGEMKHGPIALISPEFLSVFIAPQDRVFKKTISNLMEVKARHGKILLVSDSHVQIPEVVTITIPSVPELLSPFVSIPVLQLLAYHTAVILGHDVDQPRNLAKSVTVE
ncbi:MAG: glutamine--fructose-6-phosphate transaminase (isomerizing) [Candidatus Calescibacterium sp.]